MNTLHIQKLNNLIDTQTKIFATALEVKNANDTRAAVKMNTDLMTAEQLAEIISIFQVAGYSVQVFGDYLGLEKEVKNV